jgi:hypothetical protein
MRSALSPSRILLTLLSLVALSGGVRTQKPLPTMPPTMDAAGAVSEPAMAVGLTRHAIALPTISSVGFVFAPPGRFVQDREAGTARFTGHIVDAENDKKAFDIDIQFSGLSADPPLGSPNLLLLPAAYASAGGPVDPSDWYYYTSFHGTFTGDKDFRGAVLTITPRGPAAQFGAGANNRNSRYGMSAWFSYSVDQQPKKGGPFAAGAGDMNLDLQSDCMCVEDSPPDPKFGTNMDRAGLVTTSAFGCSTQWDLASTALLDVNRKRGTVTVIGELAAQADPNCRLSFEITLDGRIAPGDGNYPPNGSPSLAHIAPGGLFENGGPIDPSTWIFYPFASGTLIGKGNLEGAVINVMATPGAPSAQVGAGAARNTKLGVQATLSLRVKKQPSSGPQLNNASGTLWLELMMCPRPVFLPLGVNEMQSLPTVTTECFTLRGCALDTVTQIDFLDREITSQDPCDFGLGYFEIIDAMTIKLCPPLCLDEQVVGVLARDSLGGVSDPLPVAMVEPSAPALAVAPTLEVGCRQFMWVWGGPRGPLNYCLFFSASPLPSVIPGVVELGLGNQFTNFIGVDGQQLPRCFSKFIGMVPPQAVGLTLYFQAIPMDPKAMTLPFTPTNVGVTTYVQ